MRERKEQASIVGAEFRQMRYDRGLSQRQVLAFTVPAVSIAQLAYWETKNTPMTKDCCDNLIRALNLANAAKIDGTLHEKYREALENGTISIPDHNTKKARYYQRRYVHRKRKERRQAIEKELIKCKKELYKKNPLFRTNNDYSKKEINGLTED